MGQLLNRIFPSSVNGSSSSSSSSSSLEDKCDCGCDFCDGDLCYRTHFLKEYKCTDTETEVDNDSDTEEPQTPLSSRKKKYEVDPMYLWI